MSWNDTSFRLSPVVDGLHSGEACDSRKYPALARANCSVEQQAHWTYSDGHVQKPQCSADTSPAAREPRNSRLEQVAAKTIKSLKKADGLVVGSAICKEISDAIKRRQNVVTNVINIVRKLKNKIK